MLVPIVTLAAALVAPGVRAEMPGAAATAALAGDAALDSLLAFPSLELRPLERAVLERNPSLEAMRSAWRASEARADQAGALENPMIEATTAPQSWKSDMVDPGYMVMLRQRFPLFGERGLRGRAARETASASGEGYRTEQLDLLHETRDAFAEYYRNARSREVNAELLDLVGQFRRIAMTKYEAGTANLSDVLQADVELAMLDHERVAFERDRRVIVARLNTLLRRDPLSDLPEPAAALSPPFSPVRADSALALARATRPELRGIDAERRARSAEVSLARRGRYPEFEVQARYDRFMNERQWRPQVGVGLSLPLQFGRIGASVREARAMLAEAESKRIATLNQVEYEVAVAASRVEEIHHELEIVEGRVVPITEQSLAASRTGYESNRADFLTLLNAERDLARARLTLYDVRAEYFLALSDLERAVGTPPAGAAEGSER
ncbi:MAG TPA: TolC family protein [Candidatus Eisenbacteria bacterium]